MHIFINTTWKIELRDLFHLVNIVIGTKSRIFYEFLYIAYILCIFAPLNFE